MSQYNSHLRRTKLRDNDLIENLVVEWFGHRFDPTSMLLFLSFFQYKLKVLLKCKFQIYHFKLVQTGLVGYDESFHN